MTSWIVFARCRSRLSLRLVFWVLLEQVIARGGIEVRIDVGIRPRVLNRVTLSPPIPCSSRGSMRCANESRLDISSWRKKSFIAILNRRTSG